VYLFSNGGNEELYLGSADLMHRNLNRRIEVLFAIEDPQIKKRARSELLENAIADNTKIRWLQADGSYRRASSGDAEPCNFQEELMGQYQAPPV
jgi:polyphosphate kinase